MKFTKSRSPRKSLALIETNSQYYHSFWHSLWQKMQHLGQMLLEQLKAEEPEFEIWTARDRTGETWWSATNRRTGKSIANVSEDQLRKWIDKQQSS